MYNELQINARISNLFQFFTDEVFQVEILWESHPIKGGNYANDHENYQQQTNWRHYLQLIKLVFNNEH